MAKNNHERMDQKKLNLFPNRTSVEYEKVRKNFDVIFDSSV